MENFKLESGEQMTNYEYDCIQKQLSDLIQKYKDKHKFCNTSEKEAYAEAVLACKSVLSHYNPNNNNGGTL